jgi:hypothetical protein
MMRHAIAIGDGIDRLGGRLGEHHIVDRRRVEEPPHDLARILIGIGGRIGEEMQPPVHIGVFVRIGVADRVDHRLRLLRRGAIVEIDQRLAVHLRDRIGKSLRIASTS